MLKKLFFRGLVLLTYLSGGGNWKLRPYESQIMDAVVNTLAKNIRPLVEAQLKQRFFIDRIATGRINVFRYYSADDALKITDTEYNDLLIKVEMCVDEIKQNAHVTFYEGYLYSIEFTRSSNLYVGKEIKIGGVKHGKPNQIFKRTINSLEHSSAYKEN